MSGRNFDRPSYRARGKLAAGPDIIDRPQRSKASLRQEAERALQAFLAKKKPPEPSPPAPDDEAAPWITIARRALFSTCRRRWASPALPLTDLRSEGVQDSCTPRRAEATGRSDGLGVVPTPALARMGRPDSPVMLPTPLAVVRQQSHDWEGRWWRVRVAAVLVRPNPANEPATRAAWPMADGARQGNGSARQAQATHPASPGGPPGYPARILAGPS
jgi:hypothetical protein